ncbi:hypothetical protein SR914_02705 [Comamonas testosteroni]|uniref:hypothetical protein n=1 Tax=Comamonas TaxID=283 RepID=UPI0012D7B1AC|nr:MULTISPECIES: hypothetical protein [Comamonas]WQG67351.1 hypothetical protein SR914_02705 [Comamonas testosteroni]
MDFLEVHRLIWGQLQILAAGLWLFQPQSDVDNRQSHAILRYLKLLVTGTAYGHDARIP